VTPTLYLGNKNYSSWSMRPWLAMRWGGIAFNEDVRPISADMAMKGRAPHLLAISPSGRVPALHVDGIVINDSMAICEWAAEQNRALWPEDARARALALSAAAEMHGGFAGLRRDLAMNLVRRRASAPTLPEDTQRDLIRLFALWGDLRERFGAGGPFLFGAQRTIADAFYAPVVSRLRTYAIATPALATAYCDAIEADAEYQRWAAGAKTETWAQPDIDGLHP
jgi:glutathione S-transferase